MEKTMKDRDAKYMERAEKYIEKREARKHSGMHIAAFVLGIIAVVGNLFWYISLPCGVLAIIFGAKTAHSLGSKLGKTGMILGIIGLSLTIFAYVSMIILTAMDSYWY